MTIEELSEQLERLAGIYTNSGQFNNPRGISEWFRAFEKSSYDAMREAVTDYIDNYGKSYPPQIAEMKELVAKYEKVTTRRVTPAEIKAGNYVLPYEVATGYRDNPLHNQWVNVEPNPKKPPVYEERRAYPAYPWKFGKFEKIGDGKDSQFIPIEDPIGHSRDNPKGFWDMAQLVGAVMENVPAPDLDGYERREK